MGKAGDIRRGFKKYWKLRIKLNRLITHIKEQNLHVQEQEHLTVGMSF